MSEVESNATPQLSPQILSTKATYDPECSPTGSAQLTHENKHNEEEDPNFTTPEEILWIPCKSMDWAVIPKPVLPPKKDFDVVETFVFDAIKSRSSEDPSEMEEDKQKSAALGYRAILELLRKQDDFEMLRKMLLALRTSGGGETLGLIIRQSKKHSMLLHLIFRMDPFPSFTQNIKQDLKKEESDDDFSTSLALADAHLNLVLALVSANSVFLTPALNMLWRCIQYTEAITTEDRQLLLFRNRYTSDEEKELITDRHFLRNSRLHGTLSKILCLVPKGHSEIFPLIASDFPFKLAPLNKQASYVKQCFTVLNYIPTIRQNILELCIDKCLEIDVEIRIAQDGKVKIEEVEETDDSLKEDIFTMDEDTETKEQSVKEQEATEKVDPVCTKKEEDHVDEMAEKVS
jgi:RNA polymerase I-specific transcription initiation factor RRN3